MNKEKGLEMGVGGRKRKISILPPLELEDTLAHRIISQGERKKKPIERKERS
jgi:hypothetical protein